MGKTSALLDYAKEYVKNLGATILESYPIESTETIRDDSAHVGLEK